VTIISRSLSALSLENIIYRPLECRDTLSRLWMVHRSTPAPTSANFIRLLERTPARP